MKGYDVMGNIAIVKFPRGISVKEKKKKALRFLRDNKSVRTVLEKTGKFSGRLRTHSTKFLAGEKTKEALYKENGCVFRFNVDSCYFSPRLASERLDVGRKVKRGEKVLVMFGGVGPFAIVIGKLGKVKKVVSVEIGRECSKYAEENVKRNKLLNRVEIVQGNVRNVIGRNLVGKLQDIRFDRIIMARPNLRDSFLDVALNVIKRGGVIHYYGFCLENELDGMKERVLDEVRNSGRKIRIMRIKKAGEIGVKKFRYRLDLKML
jgi:tRNA (guanine37-N1)-methyltransferase